MLNCFTFALYVLLSSNIPVQQFVADFISRSLPQAQQLFCIAQLPNNAIHIQTQDGEYGKTTPDSLLQFLATCNTGWYSIQETPFSKNQQIGQTSLEMELDRDFLLLRNIDAKDCTLFLLVQLKPFGLSKQKYLLAAEKKQFERSIRGFVDTLLSIQGSDKEILQNIAKGNSAVHLEISETKRQLTVQNQNYEVAISQFIQLIVNKLQDKYGIEIRMSREFIDDLKNYNRPFDQLENNLEKHIQIELNFALVQGETEILLTPTHLTNLQTAKPAIAYASDDELNLGRYAKTYKLLDRYEDAARIAQQRNMSIIGKNIGACCTPAVSNASITDALNKHAKKMFELFSRFPHRWLLIRGEFRSVANIIEKESTRRKNIA